MSKPVFFYPEGNEVIFKELEKVYEDEVILVSIWEPQMFDEEWEAQVGCFNGVDYLLSESEIKTLDDVLLLAKENHC